VPLPRKYWPDVTAPAKAFIAPCAVVVPVPPLATGSVPDTFEPRAQYVVEVDPVPPLAIGKVPLMWVVRPIFPYKGAVPTPPEISALPEATSASFAKDVVVSAYSKSPTA
jgi:hypothetical protein